MNVNRSLSRSWLLCLFLQLIALPALAIDARVRASIETEGDPWIGQQVVLKVELLSNGLSFGGQHIWLPDIPGALVLEDTVSTVKLTETVDGQSWQVISYHYQMFAQHAGRIELPPIDIAFTVSEGYGSEPVSFELQTEALSFEVRSPPGVDDPTGLVTTTDFSLKVDLEPDAEGLKVGDALTRTVKRTAPAVSGMAFAPLPTPVIPGIAVYPKPPEVNDRSNRGELVGTRIEETTFVLQQDGELTIPGIELQWWDPVAEKLHSESVPALDLDVAVNPDLLPGPVERLRELMAKRPWTLLAAAVVLIAAIGACIKWLPAGLRRLKRWRTARRNSEDARFNRLLCACRESDPALVYNAYTAWVSGEDGPPSKMLGADGFQSELERLQAALIGRESGWRSDDFTREIRLVRQAGQQHRRKSESRALPALNP